MCQKEEYLAMSQNDGVKILSRTQTQRKNLSCKIV